MSTPLRSEKNERPLAASTTRMPTRVLRNTPPCTISRRDSCIREMRSRSRSSAASATGGAVVRWRSGRTARGGLGDEAAPAPRDPPVARAANARSSRTPTRLFIARLPNGRDRATRIPVPGRSTPEPGIAVAVLGRPSVAVGRPRPDEIAAAGAATHHPALWVLVVPVGDPFPYIPTQVENAERARPTRVLSDLHRASRVLPGAGAFALKVAPVRAPAIGLVTPRVLAPVAASRGLLPFALGGQTPARESAVRDRRVPIDARDRKQRCIAAFAFPHRRPRRLAASGRHTAGVLPTRHLGAVNGERLDVDLANGPLVFLAPRAALGKEAAGNDYPIGGGSTAPAGGRRRSQNRRSQKQRPAHREQHHTPASIMTDATGLPLHRRAPISQG